MPERILLSLDGSDAERDGTGATDAAIDRALDLAGPGDVVHALYVVDTARYGEPALSSAEIIVDDAEDAGQALLTEVDRRARDHDVVVHTRCRHGRPNEELPAYAAEVDADTVVLSGRRLPGRVRTELERTADRIVAPDAVLER